VAGELQRSRQARTRKAVCPRQRPGKASGASARRVRARSKQLGRIEKGDGW